MTRRKIAMAVTAFSALALTDAASRDRGASFVAGDRLVHPDTTSR